MIFAREQWETVYKRHRLDEDWIPNEIIQAAAEHDAKELGLDLSWLDLWYRNGGGAPRWVNCVILLGTNVKMDTAWTRPVEEWLKEYQK
jgi:hypothetical protein